MIGILLIAAFWALVAAAWISGRRIPGLAFAAAILGTLLGALALQPFSDAAAWIAFGLTVVVATVLWTVVP
jgi:uncharacterized membrane protein